MYELTVGSSIVAADGIGSQGLDILTMLLDNVDFKFNLFKFEPIITRDITDIRLLDLINKPLHQWGKTYWHTYILPLNEGMIKPYNTIRSPIKLCYSMFESSDAIPALWKQMINRVFDAVIVPDPFLVPIYKAAGIIKPIFVLPLGMDFPEDWFQYQHKKNDVFTFGFSGGFWSRKQHEKLILAFNQTFGNDNKVKLKLHGRFGSHQAQIFETYNKLSASNIELTAGIQSEKDHESFLKSLDCICCISMGEGFSIIPRISNSLGIPCIVSNNTAHKTICDSGFVYPIASDIKIPAYYEIFKQNIGTFRDCRIEDVSAAMLEIYNNYEKYQQQAEGGREWVRQFQWAALKNRYLSIIKPQKMILSDKNEIFDDRVETNDKTFYNKMMKEHKL